jgi:hypothetical protein
MAFVVFRNIRILQVLHSNFSTSILIQILPNPLLIHHAVEEQNV